MGVNPVLSEGMQFVRDVACQESIQNDQISLEKLFEAAADFLKNLEAGQTNKTENKYQQWIDGATKTDISDTLIYLIDLADEGDQSALEVLLNYNKFDVDFLVDRRTYIITKMSCLGNEEAYRWQSRGYFTNPNK